MWLQKTACKRGKTSPTSGSFDKSANQQICESLLKSFHSRALAGKASPCGFERQPAAAIERSQRSRATSANQAEMLMIESGLGRSPGSARDGVDRGVFLTDPRPKTGPMCCLCTRIDDARRGAVPPGHYEPNLHRMSLT